MDARGQTGWSCVEGESRITLLPGAGRLLKLPLCLSTHHVIQAAKLFEVQAAAPVPVEHSEEFRLVQIHDVLGASTRASAVSIVAARSLDELRP